MFIFVSVLLLLAAIAVMSGEPVSFFMIGDKPFFTWETPQSIAGGTALTVLAVALGVFEIARAVATVTRELRRRRLKRRLRGAITERREGVIA